MTFFFAISPQLMGVQIIDFGTKYFQPQGPKIPNRQQSRSNFAHW